MFSYRKYIIMRQDVEHISKVLTECVSMKMMKKIASKWVCAVGMAIVFLGCTIQNSPSLLTSTSNVQDATDKILTDVPFAYDLVVDTISYNSCVGSGLNSSGLLHGIKIGANEGFIDSTGSGSVLAGLKLKSEFLQYIAQNVSVIYPNTTVIPSQIQYILENSVKNQSLMIQTAVRNKTDLSVVSDVIDQSKATILLGRDGVYEPSQLSVNPVLSAITKNVKFGPNKTVSIEGPRIYNLGTNSSPDPIEASLGFSNAFDETFGAQAGVDDGFGAGEEYADRVREKFNSGQYTLAMTYGNTSVEAENSNGQSSFGLNNPKRPSTVLSKAYGRSYDFTFRTKNPSVPSQRRNILATVVEKNLETGVQDGTWSCENFVIMKTNQLNNKKASEPACSELQASDLANAVTGNALREKVTKIRRHYPESQWAIGFLIRENTVYNPATRASQPICLVNKVVDCYLPTKGIVLSNPELDVGVNYNAAIDGNSASNSECYLSRYSQMGVSYTGNKTGDAARMLGRCPQFASVCVRTR